jgi:filamentous hemagglutinin
MTADPAAWDDWMESVQKVLMPDTPENRRLLEMLVSHRGNQLGTDMYGNEWFAEMLSDGRQVWAKVRNGEIKYGGIRRVPKSFDPKKGLSSPNDP